MSERKIAELIVRMSPEDPGMFAAGLCDSLQGYYYEAIASKDPMDEDHIQKALKAWAEDELRTGG